MTTDICSYNNNKYNIKNFLLKNISILKTFKGKCSPIDIISQKSQHETSMNNNCILEIKEKGKCSLIYI